MTDKAPRDHLFISYAWEDMQFAKWLALRLTSEGYKVWIDQYKLLGGESWPEDIDVAIKTRTFRVLGLLSRFSINKPNPRKERTLALTLAKQPDRKGFLIPLNVDGLPPSELDWLTSDITFIPFSESWAKGFMQLCKLLEREGCPRGREDGRAIASRVAMTSDIVIPGEDLITANFTAFKQIPAHVTEYRASPAISDTNRTDLLRDWAFYETTPYRVLAFHTPPEALRRWFHVEVATTHAWRQCPTICDLPTHNVVSRLLRGCVETRLRMRGFAWSPATEAYTFPGRLGDDIRVVLPDGSKTTVQPSGERQYFRVGQPKVPYRYRMATRFSIERGLIGEYAVVWQLRIDFTDPSNVPIPESQRLTRRKQLTRSWFNRAWMVRHVAAIRSCADEDGLMRVGEGAGQVVLSCIPLTFTVGKVIDENKLKPAEDVINDLAIDGDIDDETEEAHDEHR